MAAHTLLGLSPEEAEELFYKLDADMSGYLSRGEFSAVSSLLGAFSSLTGGLADGADAAVGALGSALSAGFSFFDAPPAAPPRWHLRNSRWPRQPALQPPPRLRLWGSGGSAGAGPSCKPPPTRPKRRCS